jgi:pyruvate,water dikinase
MGFKVRVMEKKYKYIRFFKEIGVDDVALVGGKTSSLGEMYHKLTPQGVKVPNGFAITATAYRYILDKANVWDALHKALDGIDANNMADLATRSKEARAIVYGAPLPDDLRQEILGAYRSLQDEYGHDLSGGRKAPSSS